MAEPRSLIINSPFEKPVFHWKECQGKLRPELGRREACYDVISTGSNKRVTKRLDLANRVRERVDAWREAGWPGISSVTRSLLEHWHDRGARQYPFYFCQLEAIEALIWWVETPSECKSGVVIPGDGGPWERLCSKMATGTGKTPLMGMIIAWQVLNAVAFPKRTKEFSRAVFIVAPGLTVKERLHVLYPGNPSNIYDEFAICPSSSHREKLNRAVILVENWQSLMPLAPPERSVVKKGPESNKAFVHRVLRDLKHFHDIVVLNDEAHHAYRIPAGVKVSRAQADEHGFDVEVATKWIDGLDRIHAELGIARCFDLSATPFVPSGKTNTDQNLFDWIVTDFGLDDAIEAGLVKTPRIVVRDGIIPDTKSLEPKLHHLYRDPTVSTDLNRRGAAPCDPLPDLVQQAFTLIGADWQEAAKHWEQSGHIAPPVMLTVCNRTETAARVEYYFLKGRALWPDLCDATKVLRVDSRVLDKAEKGESAASDKDYEERLFEILEAVNIPEQRKAVLKSMKKEELLREIVDTVGKRNRAGQDLRNVVSVAMLSEGWDAKNVTHILGLRAFSSQLLCEQVIGRGLRRVSFDMEPVEGPDGITRDLFLPEYVNVFGVPLSLFQNIGDGDEYPPPPKASVQIESLESRIDLELRWPNVVRIATVTTPSLAINWDDVEPLSLDPAKIPITSEIAPAVGSVADMSKVQSVDLRLIPSDFRLQRLAFVAARDAYERLGPCFSLNKGILVLELVNLVFDFCSSSKLQIQGHHKNDPLLRRILISLSIDMIVHHVLRFVREQNTKRLEPVFDREHYASSTGEMPTWYTTRPCFPTQRSQISHIVVEGAWEQYVANLLETSPIVDAYAKNDHLGFHLRYMWHGVIRKYVPDFLIRLANQKLLVLEINGQDDDRNRAKNTAMNKWVEAVNVYGGFGAWCFDVAHDMSNVDAILKRHGTDNI